MRAQSEKGKAFLALHERESAFIIPNSWDVGTARLLAHLGFEALATTSAGFAFSIGRRDNSVGRDRMMAHVAEIVVGSVDRPVNVLMGTAGVRLDLGKLSEIGVKRVSTGSALSRSAFGAFLRAAREMQGNGTFDFAEEAVSYRDLNAMFEA